MGSYLTRWFLPLREYRVRKNHSELNEMLDVTEEFPGTNDVNIDDDVRARINGQIDISGKNNSITLRQPHYCGHIFVKLTGNNRLVIEDGCTFQGQSIQMLAPGNVFIGGHCSFNGHSVVHLHERADILIGRECLFAPNVSVSSSHVHKIINLDTGERLNPPGDIRISDHVWLSHGASIWGGADIGHDCIVGREVYVSKSFPPNCLIAGNPARIVRERVTWQF